MRPRHVVRAALLLGAALLFWAAPAPRLGAQDAPITVRLEAGGEFEGRIVEHDEERFTMRRTGGGTFRLFWDDLVPESFVTAKRSLADPKDAGSLAQLADYAADHDLRDLAEDLLARALRISPQLEERTHSIQLKIDTLRLVESEELIERGKGYIEKQEWFQALGRYRDALKLDPESSEAMNGIGEAFFYMRRLDDAREHIESAIEMDPTNKDALFNIAYLDLLELDFEGCLAGLDRLLKVPPEEGRVATREEFSKKLEEAGSDAPSSTTAWEEWVDQTLVQANDFRPIIAAIVGGPGWDKGYEAVSDHYRVQTNISQAYADRMAERLEIIYAEYERQFSFRKTGERKTRGKKLVFPVLVFETREQYVDWFTRVLRNPQMAKQTGGVYVSLVKHLVFFEGKTFDDTQLVAWHEAFHQYLDYYIAGAPHWFNEGQAEYFGSSKLRKSGKTVDLGQTNSWRIGALAQLLKQKRLPPAQILMQKDAATFMGMRRPGNEYGGKKPTNAGENYAASWALLHFLLEGKRGRYEKKLLEYFRELSDAVTHAEAFEKAFGKVKWERFNQEWVAHCNWLIARARAERDGGEIPDMPR